MFYSSWISLHVELALLADWHLEGIVSIAVRELSDWFGFSLSLCLS